MEKSKQFRDPVHDYIAIPESLCDLFIDTPIFQRLRHIEQTSFRPLYPSARHDRFSHSLGVFHLARWLFPFLVENSPPPFIEKLKRYEATFQVAALMHDCAHAPFSHLLEIYYARDERAKRFLFELVDESFRKDYQALVPGPPQAHEVFSAAIFLKHYWNQAKSVGADPLLAARMITGCCHQVAKNGDQELENSLIMLINGSAFDLDKLDYIMRDTWASGVNNTSIDVRRLLSSLGLQKDDRDRLIPVFAKSSLSVVQSVLNGRDFLRLWVIGHHTVTYYSETLRNAFGALSMQLKPVEPSGQQASSSATVQEPLLDAMFSRKVFEEPVKIGDHSLYLPTDGDVMYLLKEFQHAIPQVEELLTRRPARVPLWKTRAEFDVLFGDPGKERTAAIASCTPGLVGDILEIAPEEIQTIWVEPGITFVENKIHVKVGSDVRTLDRVNYLKRKQEPEDFYYAYIPRKFEGRIDECKKGLARAKIYAE